MREDRSESPRKVRRKAKVNKVKDVLVCVLIACLVGISVQVFMVVRKADKILSDAKNVGNSIQATMDDVDATVILARTTMVNVGLLIGRLEQTSEKWEATANKEAAYWKTLQAKSLETVDNLNATADSLRGLLSGTDKQLNGEVLPALAESIEKIGQSAENMTSKIGDVADKSGKNLDDLHSILASPEWKEILKSINGSAESLDASMREFNEAAKEAPSVAQSVEKMAKTSNKYHKALILAQIASLLGRIFF